MNAKVTHGFDPIFALQENVAQKLRTKSI